MSSVHIRKCVYMSFWDHVAKNIVIYLNAILYFRSEEIQNEKRYKKFEATYLHLI